MDRHLGGCALDLEAKLARALEGQRIAIEEDRKSSLYGGYFVRWTLGQHPLPNE